MLHLATNPDTTLGGGATQSRRLPRLPAVRGALVPTYIKGVGGQLRRPETGPSQPGRDTVAIYTDPHQRPAIPRHRTADQIGPASHYRAGSARRTNGGRRGFMANRSLLRHGITEVFAVRESGASGIASAVTADLPRQRRRRRRLEADPPPPPPAGHGPSAGPRVLSRCRSCSPPKHAAPAPATYGAAEGRALLGPDHRSLVPGRRWTSLRSSMYAPDVHAATDFWRIGGGGFHAASGARELSGRAEEGVSWLRWTTSRHQQGTDVRTAYLTVWAPSPLTSGNTTQRTRTRPGERDRTRLARTSASGPAVVCPFVVDSHSVFLPGTVSHGAPWELVYYRVPR